MKKIVVLILAISLCLTLASCGSSQPTPTDVVNTYLAAIKSDDTETISKVYAGETSDADFEMADSDAYGDDLSKNLEEKFLSFDYEVKDETIDGDKATLKVLVKTYDFGDIFSQTLEEYINQAFSNLFSDISEEELDSMMEEIMAEKLNATAKDYENTGTVNLTKTEDGWIIDKFADDSDFINALTGGLMDYANKLNDSFGNLTD